MAHLLNGLGVRTSFEEFFSARVFTPTEAADFPGWLNRTETAGEVSSISPPYLMDLPPVVVVFHQVRNPVAVIASLMGLGTWMDKKAWPNVKFNFRHLPALSADDDPLTLSMKYWRDWNLLIKKTQPVMTYRVETMFDAEVVRKILQLIGIERTVESIWSVLSRHSGTFNTSARDLEITWDRIPPSLLKTAVLEQAKRYGYSERDLQDYCPHCFIGNHGGPFLEQKSLHKE